MVRDAFQQLSPKGALIKKGDGFFEKKDAAKFLELLRKRDKESKNAEPKECK